MLELGGLGSPLQLLIRGIFTGCWAREGKQSAKSHKRH